MQFWDKFAPRRRAQRRGSTAGLLQPGDGISANKSKAKQYDKRAAPRMSNMLTRSISASLVTGEGMTMSLPGVLTSTKRASDGGATLAPPKRMSSLAPGMFRGTSTRVGLRTQPDTRWSSTVEDDFSASGNFSIEGGDFQENQGGATLAPPKRMSSLAPGMFRGTSTRVGLRTQPDTRWSSTVEDDFSSASGNFSIEGGDFQENKNAGTEMKEAGVSSEISETTTHITQARDASFAPHFDPEATRFDSSLGPDTFANFGLSFEIPEATSERRPQFDPLSSTTGFDCSLGPDTFANFGSAISLVEDTTARAPSSPTLVFESSKEAGALFVKIDSSEATENQVTAAEFEASQQQSVTLVDLKSSAADPAFASYEHSGTQSFSYSEGPESCVQFDPNCSKAQVFSVGVDS
jgi:hypothetical protein